MDSMFEDKYFANNNDHNQNDSAYNDSIPNIQVNNIKNQQTMKTPSTGENLSAKNYSSSFEQIDYSELPDKLNRRESMKNIYHRLDDEK